MEETMNTLITQHSQLLHEMMRLRNEMMAKISDADLAYKLPGNPTFGEVCKAVGEVEQSYLDSFKTFKQDFSYRNNEPGLATSVSKLNAWFKKLDDDLEATLNGLSEEDVQGKMIDRGGWSMPVGAQFHTYREALLIFYGKSDVCLKALGKPLTEQWKGWIG
jgi:hypothetical protein